MRSLDKRPLLLAGVDDQRLVALLLDAVDVDALVEFDDGRGGGAEALVVFFGGRGGVCYSFVWALQGDVGVLDDGGDVFDELGPGFFPFGGVPVEDFVVVGVASSSIFC